MSEGRSATAADAFRFIVASPAGRPAAAIPIAACRAGALGVLDLQFAMARPAEALEALGELDACGAGSYGVLIGDDPALLEAIWSGDHEHLGTVLVAAARDDDRAALIEAVHEHGRRAIAVVDAVEPARAAANAGADAIVAKGQESGGWVGDQGTFVLLQRCLAELDLPVFAQGGVGLHTAAACALAGAAGAVLDAQVLLTRESPLPDPIRERVATMDGSEAVALGSALGAAVRVLVRPDLAGARSLRDRAREIEAGDPDGAIGTWRAAVVERVGWDAAPGSVLVVGQDGCFAAELARRFATVGGIVAGLRAAVSRQLTTAAAFNPLDRGGPLATSHRTAYPIVQGPMTRVSDRAEFAADVAEAGALPFLALALLRGPEVRALLAQTRELLGDRPWGVGILGFVPAELRAEQLAAVREVAPPFALIAGGRPDQARILEQDGTATYLHVPSPGLLRLYLQDGARRFVFEGRECGGHVGPRTSFVLWDTMVRGLLDALGAGDRSDVHVLFAGGVHDARSAAMVAAITAPLAERGVRVGVLIGTAYLFTDEAVSSGAITAQYQRASLDGRRTVLLESGPGHATRCLPSPFVEEFAAERRRLLAEGCPPGEFRDRLEELNIGRLRTASKGTRRHPRYGVEPDAPKLVDVEPDEQWRQGMYMIGEVAAMHDRVVPLDALHADVIDGAAAILDALPAHARVTGEPAPPPADIAIIGVGTILPGAPDVATFWSNILEKVDAVGEVPAERWDWRAYFDGDRATPDRIYSRWGGFVGDVPFDPMAFGMPPNTLRSIEPFQLLGLMTAKAALADAGYDGDREWDRERASVMLGAGGGGGDLAVGYTVRSALPMLMGDDGEQLIGALDERLPQWTEDSFAGLLMNVAAGRIANRLDFGGTNFTVDAACGSSLAAITLGVRDLQANNSDLTIVGGVDAIQNPFAYLCFSKTHALSPTGRCRPFDADADGIAISEGFAAVVLKRLADAERDGDRIYAVIRGVGSASDGRDRSLTAPRPEGQMRALRRAYAHAHVSPADVGLVEAHGTGTVAGDRAEIEALRRVFDEHGAGRQATAVGSVKSMIGHTKATAGVAGLVKTALALHHRVLPPTLHVQTPNPRADFANSPFYPNVEARPWVQPEGGTPRRAGVSAFGFGGTNFHIVVEEHAGDLVGADELGLDRWPCELLLWRAESGDALAATLAELVGRLDALAPAERPSLADLALTVGAAADAALDAGPATPAVAAVVATSLDDLRSKLDAAIAVLRAGEERRHTPDGVHVSVAPLAADGGLALLFPGQGSQVVDMGRELAVVFPEARAAFDRADAVLAFLHETPLSRYIFPPPAFTDEQRDAQRGALTDTHVAQPALGATELAYLRVLGGLGVRGDLAAGHSYGELVALHAAGAIDETDLLRLSEARGRFMREGAGDEPGTMAAVDCGPEPLRELVDADDELVFANLNGPRQTVVSGTDAAIERALAWCGERDLRARALPVACAFHSPLVAPARDRFAEAIAATAFRSPAMPVFSNTTASAHADDPEALTATLADHLASPVRFAEEIEAMYEAGGRVFLELGPRSVLTGLTDRILGRQPHLAVATSPTGRPGLDGLLHALAAVAAEGVTVRTDRLFRGRRARRLDPRTLAPPGGRPPTPRSLWLVNGGGARPATQSLTPMTPLRLNEVTMSSTNGHHRNGHHPDQAPAPMPPAAAAPTAPVGGGPAGPVPVPDASSAGDAMAGHHLLMQHFLETQRDVMLAYLGGGARLNGGAASAPAPLRAAPERRAALPQPAAAAPPPPSAAAQAAPPPPVTAPEEADVPAGRQPDPPDPPSPAPPAASSNGAGAGIDIAARLLEIVSDRTGYPADMLDLDADLESDLGVDSIKRVEIAGTLTQEMTLPDGVEPDVEQLTASRTLRAVIAVLEDLVGGGGGTADERPPEPAGAAGGGAGPFDEEPVGGRIGRFVLRTAGAPAVTQHAALAADGLVAIIDDGRGTGPDVARRLAEAGHRAVLVDALSEDAVGPVLADLRDHGGRVKALVHLAALGRPTGDLLAPLLLLAQGLRGDLEAAADDGGAAVLGATRMGGTFGLEPDGDGAVEPRQAVLPGFLKSLAQEWPSVRVKALDLDAPAADPATAATHVLDELLADDRLVEVGYRAGARTTVALAEAETTTRPPALALDADSVVLVTGGARGITAASALELARRHRPTLVLAGRTVLPDDEEAPATAGLSDPRELQAAVIEAMRAAGEQPVPREVGSEVHRLLAVREVRGTLAALREAGARAEYRTCDVADPDALCALVDDVRAAHGRIDGVIHGAGVIEDKLIRDKEIASLHRVLATKSEAALTLADRLAPGELRFIVFFSSVSGRFGNRGQADYAAASEVLNKLAQRLDRDWPRTRVVSVNWGPWATAGMVTPEVERQFAQRGVSLIPLDVGARRLEEELRLGRKGEVEVLIGGGDALPWDGAPAGAAAATETATAAILDVGTAVTTPAPGRAEVLRRLAVDSDRFLDDHRLDGVPVLPFAGALELMAAAARVAEPGLDVVALRDVRLHQGVTVDAPLTLRITAANGTHPPGEAGRIDVTLAAAEGERPSYQAGVELAAALGPADGPPPAPLDGLAPFPLSVADAYRDLLFHGPRFQGIEAIEGIGPQGAVAHLRASAPADCLAGVASEARWLLDPVLIDCALQMQVLWARVQWGITPLPASLVALHRHRPAAAPGELVRHELRLHPTSRPPMCTADHHLYSADGVLIASLSGMLGVGSRSLNRLGAEAAR